MLHYTPPFSEVFIGYYTIIKGLHGQGLEFSRNIHTFQKYLEAQNIWFGYIWENDCVETIVS